MRERLTIRGREQLHAIGDPTRWRILGRLQVGPASIQELAVALGSAKGTIGHHVRVLERSGLIRLAETKRVRGVVEKKSTESQAEISRLKEAMELEGREREARTKQAQEQMAKWDKIGKSVEAVAARLKALQRPAAPVTA